MIMFRLRGVLRLALILAPLTLLPATAPAAEPEVVIVLRDGRFEPAEVRVPAGVKVKLVIDNQDKAAAEFESHELKREKMVQPGTRATINVGPLKPGRYPFFDEYREKTTRGVLIAE